MATLNAAQREIAAKIVQIGRQRGEPDKRIRGALAAGYVESKFKTSAVGDNGKAFGIFQMWPSKGWGTLAQVKDADYSINRWYDEAQKVDRPTYGPGELAAAVERPAAQYRGRYKQALPITDLLMPAGSDFSDSTAAASEPAGTAMQTGGQQPKARTSYLVPLAIGGVLGLALFSSRG